MKRIAFLLPASSAYYPRDFARRLRHRRPAADRLLDRGRARAAPIATTSEQWNVVAGTRGTARGWNYDTAVTYSHSDADNSATGGYVRESVLFPIVNSGVVNPFGPNDAAIVELMSMAKFDGILRTGKSTTASLDFKANKEVVAFPAGPLAIAVGFTFAEGDLEQASDPALEPGDVLNPAFAPSSGHRATRGRVRRGERGAPPDARGQRRLEVRPLQRLRRHDQSPALAALAAGAHAGGSRLGRHRVSRPGTARNVRARIQRVHPAGPERSRALPGHAVVAGLQPAVPEPARRQPGAEADDLAAVERGRRLGADARLPIGIDYVAILLDDRINFFSAQDILAQCPDGTNGPSCYLVRRGAVEPAHPALPGPIVEIDQRRTNLGKARTSAIDVNIQFAAPAADWGRVRANFTGTYNIRNEQEQLDGSYVNQVNRYSAAGGNPGVIPHWRHYLLLTWSSGPWSVSLTDNYQSGTNDQPPAPGSGAAPRKIDDYDLWDLGLSYTGFRGWTLSAGIKNLFDRDPPFSVQTQSVQVGYDPSYADPRGRLYWAGVRYTFR